MQKPDDLISTKHAARVLRCHISTVYRLCLRHKIPARKRSGKFLIRRQDLENFARGEPIPAPVEVQWPPTPEAG
jgi:excisionase family DNA binding protein